MTDEEFASLPPMWVDPGEASLSRATVFVSDPSVEAERIAQQLRAAGYRVVDVPLSMLAARVAVQTPSVVLVDADAEGVLGVVALVRNGAEGAKLDILFLGHPGKDAEARAAEAFSGGASEFFARPVDAATLLRKIEVLSAGPSSRAAGPSSSANPQPPRATGTPASVRPWPQSAGEPRTARSSSGPPLGGPSSHQSSQVPPIPGSQPDLSHGARSSGASISFQTALSPELEALMAEADRRAGSLMTHEGLPTPEEEIEAVLPAALLAALDEPIEDDDEDESQSEAPPVPPSRMNIVQEEEPVPSMSLRTSAGRMLTPLPAPPSLKHSFGMAPTMAAPPMLASEIPSRFPEPSAQIPSREAEGRVDAVSQRPAPAPPPATLVGPEDVPRRLAEGIAARAGGCVSIESPEGLRRIVLRDGDIVAAASSAEDETLLVFLTVRGDLRREQVKDLIGKVPPFGRHAGAALIGHGLLRQDQLWPTLRAHAEWVLGRTLLVSRGTSRVEAEAPGRLRQEPSVFGGSSGAEVLVEVIRRVFAPEEALRRLGGPNAIVTEGPSALLAECALDAHERSLVDAARGTTLSEIAERASGSAMLPVLYALSLLGVIVVAPPDTASRAPRAEQATGSPDPGTDALDVTAVRERVRARYELVCEADYFTLLGISRDATGYEVRRAYLELRRGFEPSRILTPDIADLEDDVRAITSAIEEAYDILRDGVRRDRYRRALGDAP